MFPAITLWPNILIILLLPGRCSNPHHIRVQSNDLLRIGADVVTLWLGLKVSGSAAAKERCVLT